MSTSGPTTTTTAEYYYVKNLQGDVIGIVDANGSLVGSYTYNAWGQVISSTDNTVTNRNPIRYRGYYYDTESGLYYLQSRYYNPEIGRFISADILLDSNAGILQGNIFVYCANNPVINSDSTGYKLDKDKIKQFIGDVIKIVDYTVRALNSSKRSGTDSIGVNGSVAAGVAVSVSAGVTYDNQGNFGLYFTPAVGGGTPAIGTSISKTSTNAPTIYHQSGIGFQVGGSVTITGVAVGAEYVTFKSGTPGKLYHGITVSGSSGGLPWVELHAEVGYSFVFGGNIYEILGHIRKSIVGS